MRFPIPAGGVNGVKLEGEVAALGYTDVRVTVLRAAVAVSTVPDPAGEQAEAAVASAVAAHDPAPTATQTQAAADRDATRFGTAAAARARAVLTDPASTVEQKDLYRLVLRAYREDRPPTG